MPKPAVVLHGLQAGYGGTLAAHVKDHRLLDVESLELLLAVDVDLEAAPAQLPCGGVEDGGVVTHVVGRIGPGAHHAGYLDLTHGI